MNEKRLKLFRLLSTPIPPEPLAYIPDCMGLPSPFLDPLHDDFGREFVTCFLVDIHGKVAIFLNRHYLDYVPYNILFNINEYNRCLKLLFPQKEYSDEFYIDYNKVAVLYDYAEGNISMRNIFRLLKAYYLLCTEKRFLQHKLKRWVELKREYQKIGVYVFVVHPRLKRLIKIYSPNRTINEEALSLVEKIGQKVPLSFSDIKYIDGDYLQKLWIRQALQRA